MVSREIWGVVYIRDADNNDPVWYEDKDEAVREYNSRSDKYWPSRLVKGQIVNVKTVHNGGAYETVPWDRAYEGHYYKEDES